MMFKNNLKVGTIVLLLNIIIIKGALLKNLGTPTSYNWDSIISASTDDDYKAILQVLKTYNIPAATIGIQYNPSPTYISQVPPTTWRNPQYWWGVGYGVSNWDAVMRGASISKPMTQAIWQNNAYLSPLLNSKFYTLWENYFGVNLPTPKDLRVYDITIKHLLDHTSGFSNSMFGYDPAFKGLSVDSQLSNILTTYNLASAPGATFSYSNFGYMILGRLAEGITNNNYINLVKQLFPTSVVPIFAGDDDIAATKEVSTYYQQSPDGYFSVEPMKGNGNIVSNAITWTWFATQYWIGGSNAGKKISSTTGGEGYTWIFDGSMPGTSTVLVQYVNSQKLVSSICILINTRQPSTSNALLTALNNAGMNFLHNKFA